MVGWEGDRRILGEYQISLSEGMAEGVVDGGYEYEVGRGGDGEGVRLCAVAWGGKLISDDAVVERLCGYVESGDIFTVGNDLFGSDPDFGRLKYGVVAYECGKEGGVKYFVGWEGERRTLGGYDY